MELFCGDAEVSSKLRQDTFGSSFGFQVFSAAFDIQDGLDGASLDFMLHPYRFDLTADVGFALALNAILRLRPGGVVVLGLCCESFSIMCLDSC